MRSAKTRADEIYEQGLFQATDSSVVLSAFGQIWSSGANAREAGLGKCKPVRQVDVFVSHAWDAGRWEKHLAMCLFLNFHLALKATSLCAILSLTASLCFPDLPVILSVLLLFDLPVLVFFIVFFFGQHLTCGYWGPSLWVDNICIDQSSESTKQRGIAELPTIVANSGELLVLWSEFHFERLWCNFELAIFGKLCDLGKVRFAPLWMAPWLLTCIAFNYMSGRLLDILVVETAPSAGMVGSPYDASANPLAYAANRTLELTAVAPIQAIAMLPLAAAGAVCFQKKLLGHKAMFADMESCDIRSAKCLLEADRRLIEGHVAELFDGLEDPILSVALDRPHLAEELLHETSVEEALMPPHSRVGLRSVTSYLGHQECLEAFNDFIHRPLCQAITNDLGVETQLSWSICALTFFPLVLENVTGVLAARPFYHSLGYASKWIYLATWFLIEFLMAVVNMPLSSACCLLVTKWVTARTSPGICRNTALVGCMYLIFVFFMSLFCLMAGTIESFAVTGHAAVLAAALWLVAVHLLLNWMFFFPEISFGPLQLPSSRLLSRAN